MSIRPPAPDERELMRHVALSFKRSYPQITSEDLEQTFYLKWYEKWSVIAPYLELADEERKPLLIRTFQNIGIDYCRAELKELAKLHPQSDDMYYYSRRQIMEMLPFVESPEAWSSFAVKNDREGGRSKADPALGNNALAHYADLRTAWDDLPAADREILRWRYVLQLEYAEIEEARGVKEANARKRVERAITRMQRSMGSDNRGRKAMSNAAAQVLTRRGYEGE